MTPKDLQNDGGQLMKNQWATSFIRGERQMNLPNTHPNGRPYLCWSHVLGKCDFPDCHFLMEGGHPAPLDIMDDFVNKVFEIIKGGGGSPSKKPRVGGEGGANN